MQIADIIFYLTGLITLTSALMVILTKDIFRAALFLAATFLGVVALFILLFADSLEKKSKLRNFFEMEENLGCSACYLDEEKSLEIITKQVLKKENILLSKEALNLIVRKANGDRGSLRNELEKIKSFSQNNKKIDYEEIKHLVNSSGEIKFDNLVNSCLCGDTSTLKKI